MEATWHRIMESSGKNGHSTSKPNIATNTLIPNSEPENLKPKNLKPNSPEPGTRHLERASLGLYPGIYRHV